MTGSNTYTLAGDDIYFGMDQYNATQSEDNLSFTPVPEPTALSLLGLGGLGLLARRRRA